MTGFPENLKALELTQKGDWHSVTFEKDILFWTKLRTWCRANGVTEPLASAHPLDRKTDVAHFDDREAATQVYMRFAQ